MNVLSTLLGTGIQAYQAYKNQQSRFSGLEVDPIRKLKKPTVAPWSNYTKPLNNTDDRLSGWGRGWGQASTSTQHQVMDLIVKRSSHLSPEDQAILLATARIESGFNPDAAATSTSASGVFQIVKDTASNLGLTQTDVFDAEANIEAGIKLFEENSAQVRKRFPKLSGDERAVMLYAFHHDGPSLAYGGVAIARKDLVPYLDDFRGVTYGKAFNEAY